MRSLTPTSQPSFYMNTTPAHRQSTGLVSQPSPSRPAVRSRGRVLALGSLAAVLFAGCATEPGPYAPVDTTKYTLENTDRFVLLDKAAQYSITCTGLQEIALPDGRMEVVANVKNRENRRLQVQINCVFKDPQGFSTGDETPWQTLILSEYATEAVRFTAVNANAKKYTVRVRQAR